MQAVVTGLWELAGFKELPGGEWPHPSPGPEPPDAQLPASLPSLPVPRLSSQHLDLLLQALPQLAPSQRLFPPLPPPHKPSPWKLSSPEEPALELPALCPSSPPPLLCPHQGLIGRTCRPADPMTSVSPLVFSMARKSNESAGTFKGRAAGGGGFPRAQEAGRQEAGWGGGPQNQPAVHEGVSAGPGWSPE